MPMFHSWRDDFQHVPAGRLLCEGGIREASRGAKEGKCTERALPQLGCGRQEQLRHVTQGMGCCSSKPILGGDFASHEQLARETHCELRRQTPFTDIQAL